MLTDDKGATPPLHLLDPGPSWGPFHGGGAGVPPRWGTSGPSTPSPCSRSSPSGTRGRTPRLTLPPRPGPFVRPGSKTDLGAGEASWREESLGVPPSRIGWHNFLCNGKLGRELFVFSAEIEFPPPRKAPPPAGASSPSPSPPGVDRTSSPTVPNPHPVSASLLETLPPSHPPADLCGGVHS